MSVSHISVARSYYRRYYSCLLLVYALMYVHVPLHMQMCAELF